MLRSVIVLSWFERNSLAYIKIYIKQTVEAIKETRNVSNTSTERWRIKTQTAQVKICKTLALTHRYISCRSNSDH